MLKGRARTSVFYGARQGTNLNSIRSARGVLISSNANRIEKLQAARILKAAQKGHLRSEVASTPLESGRYSQPRKIGRTSRRNVAREAIRIQQELVQNNPELRKVFRKAKFLHYVDRLKHHGARTLSGFDSNLPWPTGISANQQARMWRLGRAGARSVPQLTMGLAGVIMVREYLQFTSAKISTREFYRNSAGPTIVLVFTAGGTIIGAVVSGGPGAVPGAYVGGILAVPVEAGTNWLIDRYYRDFDHRQRRMADAAVDQFYGVDADLVGEL